MILLPGSKEVVSLGGPHKPKRGLVTPAAPQLPHNSYVTHSPRRNLRHREQQAKGESLIPDPADKKDPTDKGHPTVKDVWRQSQAEDLGQFCGVLGQPQLCMDREGQGGRGESEHTAEREAEQNSPERRRTRQLQRGSARHHGHQRSPAGCMAGSFPGILLESPRGAGRVSGPSIYSHRFLAGHVGPSGDHPVLSLHAGAREMCCAGWACGKSRAEAQCLLRPGDGTGATTHTWEGLSGLHI